MTRYQHHDMIYTTRNWKKIAKEGQRKRVWIQNEKITGLHYHKFCIFQIEPYGPSYIGCDTVWHVCVSVCLSVYVFDTFWLRYILDSRSRMWYACIFLDVVRQTPLTPSPTFRMATSFQPLDDNYMMMASPIKFKKGEMLAFALFPMAMPIFPPLYAQTVSIT